ncbi:Anti-sigma regulatory factor (Ser/Thr protein kinase) [Amycolatopsis xylanica]|uniref:Anti-sigma regulatory factor (Ser/Thr protein kinase) n=2 Tax=Amycolatopsis xylanica TaxID=589385 RepID=A0A1H3JWN8_9PSEU|nr:Anti-sigma regulatory factor (Ser/Thr protein kinase) [Amycolatopsis xylanica]
MTSMATVEAAANPFVHPALFYRGPREYLAGTIPFILDGLALGEPVAVSVPGPNLDLIRGGLGDAAGEVLLLDMTEEGRNPGRIIPGVLRAFADRHTGTRVRIIGEPIWPERSESEYPACAAHEALINHAFAGRRVTILCPYDVDRLKPLVLDDALRTHPVVIDVSGEHESGHYAPDEVISGYNVPLPEPGEAFSLAVDLTGLKALRVFAAEHARLAGLGEDRVGDVVLVASELAANSIVHARDRASIRIWREDRHLVCESADHGHLADPLAGKRPARPGQLGGRGLLLVNQLADLVRVYSVPGSTVIRAWFRR